MVGLDVAVKQTYQESDKPIEDEGAVYLSGNGPLVAVLNEVLAKDNYAKCRGWSWTMPACCGTQICDMKWGLALLSI